MRSTTRAPSRRTSPSSTRRRAWRSWRRSCASWRRPRSWRSRSSAPPGWSSTRWSRVASRWCRSIPTWSRLRPRYSAAQGKSDLGDAYLLADLLRTDGHRFRVLTPQSDETKGAARAGTAARRPGRAAGRHGQPAAQPARAVLARRGGDLRRRRLADRARVPRALPDAAGRGRTGREAPRRVPGAPCVLRSTLGCRVARAPARRTRRPQRRSRSRGQGRVRPRPCRGARRSCSRSRCSPLPSNTRSRRTPTASS